MEYPQFPFLIEEVKQAQLILFMWLSSFPYLLEEVIEMPSGDHLSSWHTLAL